MFFREYDYFSIKIAANEEAVTDFHDKTIDFLEQYKRGSMRIIIDDINNIEIEHSVKNVRFGYYWRLSFTPMVVIKYSFKITDSFILIDSRIQYTSESQPSLIKNKSYNLNWILKNRDFIHKYVELMGLENDSISREIYPKDLLDEYLNTGKKGIINFILILHGIISLITLLAKSFTEFVDANILLLVFIDPIIWFSYWIQSREYRIIQKKYMSAESENN